LDNVKHDLKKCPWYVRKAHWSVSCWPAKSALPLSVSLSGTVSCLCPSFSDSLQLIGEELEFDPSLHTVIFSFIYFQFFCVTSRWSKWGATFVSRIVFIFDADPDPDPTPYFDADPDQAFHFDADPDPPFLRIQIIRPSSDLAWPSRLHVEPLRLHVDLSGFRGSGSGCSLLNLKATFLNNLNIFACVPKCEKLYNIAYSRKSENYYSCNVLFVFAQIYIFKSPAIIYGYFLFPKTIW
jgi:hypothetical protein